MKNAFVRGTTYTASPTVSVASPDGAYYGTSGGSAQVQNAAASGGITPYRCLKTTRSRATFRDMNSGRIIRVRVRYDAQVQTIGGKLVGVPMAYVTPRRRFPNCPILRA